MDVRAQARLEQVSQQMLEARKQELRGLIGFDTFVSSLLSSERFGAHVWVVVRVKFGQVLPHIHFQPSTVRVRLADQSL